MEFKDLIRLIEEIADPELSEDWDNCGTQINAGKNELNKVLITLEITKEVIGEAQKSEADLIVSHHPLLFHPIQKIDANTPQGNYLFQLIQSGISVYCAHTSFDKAPDGNNVYMARKIGLKEIRHFCDEFENPSQGAMGIMGQFEETMSLREACKWVGRALDLPKNEIRAVGDLKKEIRTVGLCTGAGSDLISLASRNQCDLFITGDVKYHEAQKAKEDDFCLMDAGHYGTEKIFAENFARQLREKAKGQIEVIESKIKLNPFSID